MNKGVKRLLAGLGFVVIVATFYYLISNRDLSTTSEVQAKMSVVQDLLSRNLTKDYPPTPKEVVKLYADITVALYSEDYSDEEYTQLALLMRSLFDAKLAANTEEDVYLNSLKNEINEIREPGYKISSYSLGAATDVEYFKKDGHECARLRAAFTMKNIKNKYVRLTRETFILRKDIDGHWKIFGWAMDKDDEEQ